MIKDTFLWRDFYIRGYLLTINLDFLGMHQVFIIKWKATWDMLPFSLPFSELYL